MARESTRAWDLGNTLCPAAQALRGNLGGSGSMNWKDLVRKAVNMNYGC